jgi:ATP-dependent Clp protease protease subunit
MTASRYNRSPFKKRIHNGLKIENKTEESTVYIYDEISFWGISADDFVKELQEISAGIIHVRLNSPGGSVFDGTAIYNALKQHSAKVVVHVDGLAASIASVIAMAGDEVHMGEGSYLMVHDPWSIMIGTADDFRQEADLLDKVGGTISGIYQSKTGKDETEIKDMMAAETWLTADEAVEMGFADKVDKGKEKKNQVKNLFDLSVFANVPDALRENKGFPTERDIERALRDVGCSQKMAKAILAEGLKDDHRDDASSSEPQAVEPQRDVEKQTPIKAKDRTAELLIRAIEMTSKAA